MFLLIGIPELCLWLLVPHLLTKCEVPCIVLHSRLWDRGHLAFLLQQLAESALLLADERHGIQFLHLIVANGDRFILSVLSDNRILLLISKVNDISDFIGYRLDQMHQK